MSNQDASRRVGVAPSQDPTLPVLLTVPEAAQLLHIGTTTLWTLIRSGEVPVVRIGRSVRVARRWVEAMAADPS